MTRLHHQRVEFADAAWPDGFARTKATAADAERISALLLRVAQTDRKPRPAERAQLRGLATRYSEYAAALRETVGDTEPDRDAATGELFCTADKLLWEPA